MNFRIADTFTDSLARLNRDEQKAVKTTAFDLQLNPINPGMSFHKLDRAKDKNFWSVRVSADIRIIVHKTEANLLLCYVDHHDKAYQWAERRKLEVHPKTGAAQLVELRERVEEIVMHNVVPEKSADRNVNYLESIPKPLLFAQVADATLLAYGVPEEWLQEVHQADEDTLLELTDHLPAEAAEALLELATGGKPQVAPVLAFGLTADPFAHPDAQRRFRVMANVEELEQALDYPWEKWSIFLHPAQRELVEKDFSGPARVSGSAGTGKTIVALHRAVYLARQHPEARVLLTTFSESLASALRTKLRRLISAQPRLGEQLEVHALDAIGQRLFELHFGKLKLATQAMVRQLLQEAASKVPGHGFSQRFLETEWEEVVDSWQLQSWDDYREVRRLGRKTRLPEARREVLWRIFAAVREALLAQGVLTRAAMFTQLGDKLQERKHPPFEFAVIDEAQDVSVAQLRFLSALGTGRENSLFFAGDLGQRIFQTPFSWKSLGVDIRGRSQTLRINYRTSHQIRMQADRLLGPEVVDVDGNIEDRRGTVSVFNGPSPDIRVFDNTDKEAEYISSWIKNLCNEGYAPHEIGVFVRSHEELERARIAAEKSSVPFQILDDHMETTTGKMTLSTMHLAKGLEFRAVVVMACDDEIIPSQPRMESAADDSDLEVVYNTERNLLYVACTRARDKLLITSSGIASEFLDDFQK